MAALMLCSNSTMVSFGHSFLRISSRLTTSPACSSSMVRLRKGCSGGRFGLAPSLRNSPARGSSSKASKRTVPLEVLTAIVHASVLYFSRLLKKNPDQVIPSGARDLLLLISIRNSRCFAALSMTAVLFQPPVRSEIQLQPKLDLPWVVGADDLSERCIPAIRVDTTERR